MSLRKRRAEARAEARAMMMKSSGFGSSSSSGSGSGGSGIKNKNKNKNDNDTNNNTNNTDIISLYKLEIERLQSILDIFIDSFLGSSSSTSSTNPQNDNDNDNDNNNAITFSNNDIDSLKERIQIVKGLLYDRDYLNAFGSKLNLEAYVMRWSPSRALAYFKLFENNNNSSLITETLKNNGNSDDDNNNSNNNNNSTDQINVMSIGGGAGAEIVAFGAILKEIKKDENENEDEDEDENSKDDKNNINSNTTNNNNNNTTSIKPNKQMKVTAIDIADWSHVVNKLQDNINKSWFSQNKKKEANPSFQVDFIKRDVLELFSVPDIELSETEQEQKQKQSNETVESLTKTTTPITTKINVEKLLSQQKLVTVMFTINELFKENKSGTMKFLNRLRDSCTTLGTLLIFVESAGSYSDIQVGSKTFPVQFLIHHTLTTPINIITKKQNTQNNEKNPSPPSPSPKLAVAWERVQHCDSQWYRIPEPKYPFLPSLEYPLKLENMRYFVSIYKRIL